MPIIGLTDRPASFPQIGILRKGAPSEKKVNQQGKEYSSFGRDLKHFRFDTDDADAAGRRPGARWGNNHGFGLAGPVSRAEGR